MDGSSASSPAFAGLISLLNAELKRMDKPPLGFLNTWLYQVSTVQPDAFEDIIFGNTYSDEKFQCKFGYVARPGWDPMTGLGIPRFEVLRKYLPHHLPLSGPKPAPIPNSKPSMVMLAAEDEAGVPRSFEVRDNLIGAAVVAALAAFTCSFIALCLQWRGATQKPAHRWQNEQRAKNYGLPGLNEVLLISDGEDLTEEITSHTIHPN